MTLIDARHVQVAGHPRDGTYKWDRKSSLALSKKWASLRPLWLLAAGRTRGYSNRMVISSSGMPRTLVVQHSPGLTGIASVNVPIEIISPALTGGLCESSASKSISFHRSGVTR